MRDWWREVRIAWHRGREWYHAEKADELEGERYLASEAGGPPTEKQADWLRTRCLECTHPKHVDTCQDASVMDACGCTAKTCEFYGCTSSDTELISNWWLCDKHKHLIP